MLNTFSSIVWLVNNLATKKYSKFTSVYYYRVYGKWDKAGLATSQLLKTSKVRRFLHLWAQVFQWREIRTVDYFIISVKYSFNKGRRESKIWNLGRRIEKKFKSFWTKFCSFIHKETSCLPKIESPLQSVLVPFCQKKNAHWSVG